MPQLASVNISLIVVVQLILYASIEITRVKNSVNFTNKSLNTEYLNGLEQYLYLILGKLLINIIGYSIAVKQVIIAHT